MSKINSEDYEKIEKINLDQQKAIKENAKAVVMKEIQEENDKKNYNELSHRVLNLREKCKDRNFKIRVLYILLILSNLITFDITYHYQYNTVSYTQYNIQTIIDWSYALLYLCYLIFSDMISGIYRAFMSN